MAESFGRTKEILGF